ncbi:MAG: SxtJ family membrane protein [Stygiobacter sp.]|jgi:hypothetical protein|uniref:SxtJ family membrane protein n=1 Tax=Stygiobacter electus TaxID=3032292 RepID=A0AAE3P140_9BACT|nr:SxtJ family membrane protein [Stygiobacter electus]MDF1612462.1 SxtJ family membrane protein [Stygiobacter electus]
MSWIKDVKNELASLDVTNKSLKKFGFVIGGIFLLLGLLFFLKNLYSNYRNILFVISFILIISGLLFPSKLKSIYKIWMGFAFALGWIVSRLILIILFYFVLSPVGFFAKLFKKEFLDVKFKDGKNSYWIEKKKQTDYEKLY